MDPEPNQEPKAHAAVADASGVAGEGLPTPTSSKEDVERIDPSAARSGVRGSEAASAGATAKKRNSSKTRPKAGSHPNNVRKLRQRAMMSKAELARRAGVSPLTIDRVEAGCPCRMDTKRKILEALGLDPTAAPQVFPDVDLG